MRGLFFFLVVLVAFVWGDAKSEGKAFLEKNKGEEGVVTTASGMQYKILNEGNKNGPKPKKSDKVEVHYVGTLLDGTEFDSSVKRGKTIEFGLNQVIPCWTEGVQMMNVGAKHILWCPQDMAYGPSGAGGVIPPYATLKFEVELVSIPSQK